VEALVDWYSKVGVFVNPNYVDNFPTTNSEALACGTLVLTYNKEEVALKP
jgi:glycosyltransferase involved in cell wall biosynthesis